MKKYILVETEVSKQTPFRHFSDLINLHNPNSIGVDPITDFDQRSFLMPHNRFRRDLILNTTDNDLYIECLKSSQHLKIDLDTITEIIHSGNAHENWVCCGYVFSKSTDTTLGNLRFWYRDKKTQKLIDCFSKEVLNNGESFISNTVFLVHGTVKNVPVYHFMLNDDVIFNANCVIDTEKYFISTVNFHDGTFKEFLFKPGVEKAFLADNIIIAPGNTFNVDFYARTALRETDFPFELLQLKIKTNIDYEKIGTGRYKFNLDNSPHGYIYARINSSFGAEQEKSTTLRAAYSVHKG